MYPKKVPTTTTKMWCKSPSTLETFKACWKEPSHWWGAFSLRAFVHLSPLYTRPLFLSFLQRLDGTLTDSVWKAFKSFEPTSWRSMSVEILSFGLVSPQPMSFQILFCLVINSTIMPLISQFEHDHFTLAQTIESIRFGEAFDSLSFWMNGCEIQVSDSQNCKLSSQLELYCKKCLTIMMNLDSLHVAITN